jgi:hypothetical protein
VGIENGEINLWQPLVDMFLQVFDLLYRLSHGSVQLLNLCVWVLDLPFG